MAAAVRPPGRRRPDGAEEARGRRRGILERLQGRRERAGSDDRATAELIRQRWAQAALPTSEVSLEVRAGVVTLRGTVAGREERRRIEVAAAVPGIRRVDSRVILADRAARP